MRSVRIRILAVLVVLAAVGVGGWQLLPSKENGNRTITVGTTDAVMSTRPAGAYDAGSWALFSNVFQRLLTFDPSGGAAPVPDAAKSCGFVGAGLRTYACTLRDDLTFPSGSKVTAEDVKFSFDRVKAINSEVGPASLLSTGSVDARGLKVTFHLSSPDATFPFKVATGAGSIVDHTRYPKHALRKDAGADGTGVYVLKSYTKDKRAVLVPNKHYKGSVEGSGTPTVLRYYATPKALESAWKAKQVDVATRQLPPATLATLSPSDPNQHVTESDSAETRNLVLNVRELAAAQPPRTAGRRRTDQPRATGQPDLQGDDRSAVRADPGGHHGALDVVLRRLPQARREEGEGPAGRGRGVDAGALHLRVRRGTGRRRRGGHRAQASAGGERPVQGGHQGLRVDRLPEAVRRGPVGRLGGRLGRRLPRPGHLQRPLVGTGNSMKNGYSDKDVDRLIQDSQQYEDRSRTSDDFQTLQEIVARDVPLISLWQRKEYVLSSEDVGGGQYLSDGTGVFRLWRLSWDMTRDVIPRVAPHPGDIGLSPNAAPCAHYVPEVCAR